MEITASKVKELREKTGVGMMDCKKALVETNGDFESAIKYLREKGLSAAAKKADRTVQEGRIFISGTEQKATLLALNCETDFVANNDKFIAFGEEVSQTLNAQSKLISIETIGTVPVNGKAFEERRSEEVLKLGENISVNFIKTQSTTGKIASYVHSNGKIGVLVEFNKTISDEIGKDIAMHIAAINPSHIQRSDISEDEINKEKEIIRNQALNEGKPEAVVDKIVMGRVSKYYKENCLLEQDFVKDPEKTIKDLLPEGTQLMNFTRLAF